MNLSIRKKQIIFLLIYTVFCVAVKAANAEEIKLAVASNFLKPMQSIVAIYEKKSKQKVTISSGSTGKLYAQIVHGAPYDLFFAANSNEPIRLEREGYAVSGSRMTYAVGKIVLWSKNYNFSDSQDIRTALNNRTIKTMAIANPKTAPYGVAAMEVLKKLNIDQGGIRIIRGENINQTWQFVHTGSVDIGFIAASQLDYAKPEGHYINVPADLYQPIEQQVVLLTSSKHARLASDFLQFIQSESIRNQIARHGYNLFNTSSTFVMQKHLEGG